VCGDCSVVSSAPARFSVCTILSVRVSLKKFKRTCDPLSVLVVSLLLSLWCYVFLYIQLLSLLWLYIILLLFLFIYFFKKETTTIIITICGGVRRCDSAQKNKSTERDDDVLFVVDDDVCCVCFVFSVWGVIYIYFFKYRIINVSRKIIRITIILFWSVTVHLCLFLWIALN